MKLYRASNAEKSPVLYSVDPRELFHIHQEVTAKGWDILGIYHSHTHTEAYPSATDVQLALWPESIYLIISLQNPHDPQIRAFYIKDGKIEEEELETETTPQ